MVFALDHPEFLDMPKGMKQILIECGLWSNNLCMQCKNCEADVTHCCAKWILDLQPDFAEQHSLVQEMVETTGHLCIFLPKSNFIECG